MICAKSGERFLVILGTKPLMLGASAIFMTVGC